MVMMAGGNQLTGTKKLAERGSPSQLKGENGMNF
jgi:hypothetical protein